jgi:hypothetical protein
VILTFFRASDSLMLFYMEYDPKTKYQICLTFSSFYGWFSIFFPKNRKKFQHECKKIQNFIPISAKVQQVWGLEMFWKNSCWEWSFLVHLFLNVLSDLKVAYNSRFFTSYWPSRKKIDLRSDFLFWFSHKTAKSAMQRLSKCMEFWTKNPTSCQKLDERSVVQEIFAPSDLTGTRYVFS